jgi:hypothetical protein
MVASVSAVISNAPPDSAQVEAALRIIAELPQAAHIKPETARAWLEAVSAREPERLRWHALRARGIGGSEMCAVMDAMEGRYHPFTSGEDVARQKLLLAPPEDPTPDTRRGVFMEGPLRDMVRPLMLKEFRAKPADDVIEAIAEIETGGDRRNPWQVGNPDDIFRLPNGQLIMMDYKAPRPDVLAGYAVFGKPRDYIVQLHHYTMLAMERGFEISKLILTSLDYNRWCPAMQEIPLDTGLIQRIEATGTRFWNEHVLKGVVPAPVEAPIGKAGEIPRHVLEEIHEIGRTLCLANASYRQARDRSTALSAVIGNDVFLGQAAVAIDHIDLLVSSEVDESRVKRVFELWGEKIDDYRLPAEPNVGRMEARLAQLGEKLADFYDAGALDADRVRERLRRGREKPEKYMHESVEVKLTPLRRGERADMLFAVRDQAQEVIETFSKQPNPDPVEVAENAKRKRAEWKAQQNGGGAFRR